MALSQRKIQLFAKIEGEDDDKDTFCHLNSDTFEIADFDKEPIICKLYVSASKKLRESISVLQPRSLKSTGDYDFLLQQIESLNNKLDNIRKDINQKKSNINVHGQTIWITGLEGFDDIQTERKTMPDTLATNVTEVKEYGINFTQRPEQTLESSHGSGYTNATYDKRDNAKSDVYLKSNSAGRLSVNKNELDQMKITGSRTFIKQECPDIELEANELQKISISRETLAKFKSGPPDELYYSDRRSSITTVQHNETLYDRKSTTSNYSFCTN